MAGSALSASEIQDQLRQEEEWLKLLEGNLQKSKQLKNNMKNILDSFESRLDGLEKTVLPIYEHTGKLQRRQLNVSKCVKEVEATIGFYTVANETDSVIRDASPGDNLTSYLGHMDKLAEAVKFFEINKKSNAQQLDSAKSTYEMGCTSLLKEFESKLLRDTTTVKPAVILEALNENYVAKPNAIKSDDLLHKTTVDTLSKIATWMQTHASHSVDDMNRVYKNEREKKIQETLRGIAASHTELGALNVAGRAMASPKNPRRATVLRNAATGRKDSRTLTSPNPTSNKRTDKINLDLPSEYEIEQKAETVVLTLATVQILLEAEESLMRDVIKQNKSIQQIKMTLLNKPLLYILGNFDGLFSMVRKSIGGGLFVNTVCMYKVSRYLHQNYNSLEILFKTCGKQLEGKFVEFCKMSDSLCKQGLEGLIECLTSDQDKYVPKDATVHQQTSNTLYYLESLMEYKDSLASVIADDRSDKVSVSKQFARVLSALGLNLRNKSMMYHHDQTVKALFLLNNYNHIVKSVQKSGVLKLVCEQSREVETYYHNEVNKHQQIYIHSWNRLAEPLLEVQRGVAGNSTAVPPGSLTEKHRDQVKTAFANFNKDFDYVCATHATYSVPDAELAMTLKEIIRKVLVATYATFHQTFQASGFSSKPDKYVKYSAEQLSVIIDRVI